MTLIQIRKLITKLAEQHTYFDTDAEAWLFLINH